MGSGRGMLLHSVVLSATRFSTLPLAPAWLDHLQRERLDLSGVRTLVLDEADRMLEMGFVETVGTIARAVPAEHQTLLFSATFPDAVRALSTTYQRDALHVTVPAQNVAD